MPATQEFEFVTIELTADREFNSPDDPRFSQVSPLKLTNLTSEINLFEDVMKGYITAKLVVLDDGAIFSQVVEMQGTERLHIQVKGMEGNEGQIIDIHMKVVSIVSQTKFQDRASVFVINAISDHGYRDSLSTVSRSYTGQLEDTTENILKSYLKLKVKSDSESFPDGE